MEIIALFLVDLATNECVVDRLQHIITIGDALEALDDDATLPPLNPFLSALERVSRYVQLQPNWNGLGIDGNAMIDDFLANAQERLKALADRTPTYPDANQELSDG